MDKHLLRILLCLLTPLFHLAVAAAQAHTNFTVVPLSFSPGQTVTLVDLSANGLPDVLDAGNRRYYLQQKDLQFTTNTINTSGIRGFPAFADYNNDGLLDYFAFSPTTSFLFDNSPSGLVRNTFLAIQPIGEAALAWGDLDRDGDLDLVTMGDTNIWNLTTRIYINEEAKRFRLIPSSGVEGLSAASASLLDLDNDGDLDLYVQGINTRRTAVSHTYLLDNGLFIKRTNNIAANALPFTPHKWGDVDNDGDLDLFTPVQSPNRLAINDGAGLLTPKPLGPSSIYLLQRGDLGDYDGDGDLDIVLCINRDLFIYINDGSGGFTDSGFRYTSSTVVSTFAWADIDGDDDLDLVLVNTNPVVLLNQLSPQPRPAPPENLQAFRKENSIVFRWSSPKSQTHKLGFTYNIRIGTSPGGMEVVSPAARLTDGRTLLTEIGNAGTRTNFTLNPTRNATYYWSVQTVDHRYVGSEFTPEQMITVDTLPPKVIEGEVVQLTSSSAVLKAPVLANDSDAAAWVEWGKTENSMQKTEAFPILGTNWQHITVNLQHLEPAMSYFFRTAASNAFGLSTSIVTQFRTHNFSNFTVLPSGAVALVFSKVDIVDWDADGDLDFSMTGHNTVPDAGSTTAFLYRNELGILFDTGIHLQSTNAAPVCWFDADMDGDMDVVTGTTLEGRIQTALYENRGGGQFIRIPDFPLVLARHNYTSHIVSGDIDNDGDIDLLVAGNDLTQASAAWLINEGNLRFTQKPSPLPVGIILDMELVDYNQDGYLDLSYTWSPTQSSPAESFLVPNRQGQFDPPLLLPEVEATYFDWGDADNDGDFDMLFAGHSSGTNYVGLLRQTAPDLFERQILLPTAGARVLWTDVNGDGRLDISQTAAPQLALQDASGIFNTFANPFRVQTSLTQGDIDGDGRIDFLISGVASSPIRYLTDYLHNNFANPNTPPRSPAGLRVSFESGIARLAWDPATDAEQPGGLTYNVRVGTAPGLGNVISPQALPNGRLLQPAKGNAGLRTFLLLKGLAPGKDYSWTVQAVDHGFASSPFATEHRFTLPEVDNLIITLNPKIADGHLHITVSSSRDGNYILQSSDTFQAWIDVSQLTVTNRTGAASVKLEGTQRFYRLKF